MSDNQVNKSSERPDVEAIMAKIRSQVKSELSSDKASYPKYAPPASRPFDNSVSPILYSDELNFLNANCGNWSLPPEITSHRRFLGRFIVKIKQKIRNFLWNSILKDYFEKEREFQMQLVRHLNSSARYVDARDAELFWQIVKKVDNDVSALNERGDRLFDHAMATLSNLESKISKDDAETSARSAKESVGQEQVAEVDLKQRASSYLKCFKGLDGTVLELYSSDADFLELLKESDIEGFGVSVDQQVVEQAKRRGLSVTHSDIPSYLMQLPDRSIAGVFASGLSQFCNSLEIAEILDLSLQKLKAGGKVVIECQSSERFASVDVIKALMESKGLLIDAVVESSEAQTKGLLEPIEVSDYLPARWRKTVETINANIELINDRVFAGKFYAVVGVLAADAIGSSDKKIKALG